MTLCHNVLFWSSQSILSQWSHIIFSLYFSSKVNCPFPSLTSWDLGQNAKDKRPIQINALPKPKTRTPNTKVSGISYIGVLSVSLWPDTTSWVWSWKRGATNDVTFQLDTCTRQGVLFVLFGYFEDSRSILRKMPLLTNLVLLVSRTYRLCAQVLYLSPQSFPYLILTILHVNNPILNQILFAKYMAMVKISESIYRGFPKVQRHSKHIVIILE